MITHFSTYKDAPTKQGNISQTQSGDNYGWLPTAGGIIGGVGGAALGTPADIVSGPVGTVVGGGLGAAAGGAIGKSLQNILNWAGGQKQTPLGNLGSTLGAGAEQGLYGAIPGGSEFGGNLLGRTAVRAVGGALGGMGTQAVRNVEQGKPITDNLLGQGVMTGALNTLIPGATAALNIPSKFIGKLGKTAVESASGILENKGIPALQAISHLFGTTAIGQEGGKSFVSPEVSNFIATHKIPIPPQENWLGIKPAVLDAQKNIEKQLEPFLSSQQATMDNVKAILNENKDKFASGDRRFLTTLPKKVQQLFSSSSQNVDLYTLKQAQRELGDVANWNNPTKTPLDKFAIETYNDLGKLIDSHFDKSGSAALKDLNNQHKIAINLKQNIKDLEKSTQLPDYISSARRAETKAQTGLSKERLAGLGIHTVAPLVGAAAALGTQFLPIPSQLKELAALGAGGYALAEFGPHINPEIGLKIGQKLQNTPQVGPNIQKLLQQLGVRL